MTGHLSTNLVRFARALRKAGLKIGPGSVVDTVDTLTASGALERQDLYWTLHACLVTRHEDSALFGQAFDLFFRRRSLGETMSAMLAPENQSGPEPAPKPEAAALRLAEAFAGDGIRESDGITELMELDASLSLSDMETLRSRDFGQMTAQEIAQALRLICAMAMPDDTVRTRRYRPARQGQVFDMRATLRRSLRSGGAVIDLARRAPRREHPPIVALIDISGSMAEYSRILLHFMHALAARRARVHSFVFGTQLTNVTRLLLARDPDEALALCGQAAPDWEGGTRISAALHAFNRTWSRRVMAGGPVVLLFTDGLERLGDGTVESGPGLAFEMDRLHRSCRRLVWLNPLLRHDAFEPKASGIRAMLPHVDEFRPIHNLASMSALCQALDARGSRGSDPRRWMGAA